MSSETSTERPQESLQPWQLFTLAGLIGATVVVFLSRGQTPAAIILLSLAIFAAAYVGVTALRTVLPLAGALRDDGAEAIGDRTRAALEREKTLVLRSIKELEFDRAMGKVSEKDFVEMSGRLRVRAARLIRQLDAGAGYRGEIEREVTKRIGEVRGGSRENPVAGSTLQDPVYAEDAGQVLPSRPAGVCASCNTTNDGDARFCKHCGHALGSAS